MQRILVLFSALVLACPVPAAEVSVRASRDGQVLRVEAIAEFDADLHETWRVLTDYDHLADFIPGMLESRIVDRGTRGPVVEQRGEAKVLFFVYPINVRLAVEEYPYERIVSHAVSGNFKRMDGAYTIEAAAARVRLRYVGTLVPDFFVPPLIGAWVLRLNVERQFAALIDEISRQRNLTARKPPL